MFVLPNEINEGESEVANLYFLQKVYEGAFEVCINLWPLLQSRILIHLSL